MTLSAIEIDGYGVDHDFNENLEFSGHNAILDSGTTYVYLEYAILRKMKKSISKYCSESTASCGGYNSY